MTTLARPTAGALPLHPRVSIVIPTLDEGDWIRRTVTAALATAGVYDLEVVVVDDGSSDGSCDFIDEELGADGRVRRLTGGHLGVARARNLGASQATGDVVVFIDANVLPDPGWLDELVSMLRDPTVGIAGVGVRDAENAASISLRMVFIDERLQEGWAPAPTGGWGESPLIIGCCVAMRRQVYESVGGFDPRHERWGVEDVELSLRVWRLGYRVVVSRAAQVAHYFKHNKPRNFSVTFEQYDINLLHCALLHFSGEVLLAVLDSMRERHNFAASLAAVMEDAAYWEWRDSLLPRFHYDEHWYFRRFADEFASFLARVDERTRHRREISMTSPLRDRKTCGNCGATNVGPFYACVICQAPLPMPAFASTVAAVPMCTNCGRALTPGAGFCNVCGTKVETARATAASTSSATASTLHGFNAMAITECGNCGNGVPPGQRFCGRCGRPSPVGVPVGVAQHAAPPPPVTPPIVAGPPPPPPPPPAPPLAAPTAALCTSCGNTVPADKRFCGRCGTPLAIGPVGVAQRPVPLAPVTPPIVAGPPPPPPAPAAAPCKSCGAVVPPDKRFCVRCGTAVAGGLVRIPAPPSIPQPLTALNHLAGGGPSPAPAKPNDLVRGFKALPRPKQVAAAALVVAPMTTFLDWVTAGPFGASAWDGNGSFRLAEWLGIDALDALLVVVAALAGLAFIVAPLLGKTLRPVPFAVAGAGAGLLFIGVLNIWYITSEGGEGVSVGLGVYALIAAGGTAAVCGYIDERPPASRRPT